MPPGQRGQCPGRYGREGSFRSLLSGWAGLTTRNVYPLNLTYPTTNWGQGLPENTWWHLAVVNDGKHTIMYIEGSPTVDNPTLLRSTGITQLALPWALGGYEYGGSINQIFHGWVGDIRIVGRPLSTSEFMIAR